MPQNLRWDGSLLWTASKCLETLCLSNPFWILHTCSLIRTFRGRLVRPTYCRPQLHSSTFTAPSVLHPINSVISYWVTLLLDWKRHFLLVRAFGADAGIASLTGIKTFPCKERELLLRWIDNTFDQFVAKGRGPLINTFWPLWQDVFQFIVRFKNMPMAGYDFLYFPVVDIVV